MVAQEQGGDPGEEGVRGGPVVGAAGGGAVQQHASVLGGRGEGAHRQIDYLGPQEGAALQHGALILTDGPQTDSRLQSGLPSEVRAGPGLGVAQRPEHKGHILPRRNGIVGAKDQLTGGVGADAGSIALLIGIGQIAVGPAGAVHKGISRRTGKGCVLLPQQADEHDQALYPDRLALQLIAGAIGGSGALQQAHLGQTVGHGVIVHIAAGRERIVPLQADHRRIGGHGHRHSGALPRQAAVACGQAAA